SALRDRGVEAYGIDISDYALSHVREDIQPFCVRSSLTDPLPAALPQHYDLVITIEVLEHLIDSDEGSHYLGDVALVPHQSPISESNILFYNTLFDENASNHLAIGSGYAFNVEGGKKMSREELTENGVNSSITHVDFMIGSADMDIDGIQADGTVVPVFRKGNWAI
ncbi:MAG: aminopeptidase, partial [Paenibacillus sp.]|nr:aminopeptidase [Paenibacillus sp.]